MTQTFIEVRCPCTRPHDKRYDSETKYTQEKCEKILTWVGADQDGYVFGEFCNDCKKTIYGEVKDGVVYLRVGKEKLKLSESQMVVLV